MATIKKIFHAIYNFFRTINKANWRYKAVAIIGLVFRVVVLPYCIPDIYELIFSYVIPWEIPGWLYQILLRIFLLAIDFLGLGAIYYLISFASTGLCYKKKSNPALGSAYYTFYYVVYSIIPILLIRFFYWWVIVIVFLVYVILCFLLYCISDRTNSLPDNFLVNMIAHLIIAVVSFVAVLLINVLCF